MGMLEFTGNMTTIPMWAMLAILIVLAWSSIWKIFALWKAAKKDSWPWFIILFLFNTFGILEILYIYVFSERKGSKKQETKPAVKEVPKAKPKTKAKKRK